MTTTLPVPVPTPSPDLLGGVLTDLATVLDDVLGAALEGDVARARAVLRTGRRRRARLGRLTTLAGLGLPSGTSRQRRATTDLVLLTGDLQRLERVVEQLARVTLAHGHPPRDPGTSTALEQLRTCGVERLRNLAEHPRGPQMTRDHHRCGHRLLALLAELDPPTTPPSTGAPDALRLTAAALTAVLIDASRHAARASLGDQVA